MPRPVDPLKAVKRDVDLSLNLWRSAVTYFMKRLDSGDKLTTREMEQINIFLSNNDINLSKFVSLNQVSKVKSIDELSGGLDQPLSLPSPAEDSGSPPMGGLVRSRYGPRVVSLKI